MNSEAVLNQVNTQEALKYLHHSRVLSNVASNYFSKVVSLGLGFLLTPFILRELGTTRYALWALVGSVVGYGSLLELGIGGSVTKYVAELVTRGENEEARDLIAAALRLYMLISLAAIALSAVIAVSFPVVFHLKSADAATASVLVLLMGLNIGISIPCATAPAVLFGLQRYDLVNLVTTAGALFSAAAVVVVLLLGGGVIGMVAVNIPVTLAMQAASIRLIRRIAPELHFGKGSAKRALVRRIISFSSPLFVSNVAWRVQTKTDEITIGIFLPISAITPYALALRLSEISQILTDQFMKIILPLASSFHAENERLRLRALYLSGTRLALAIFVPLGTILIVLGRPFLAAWVGAEYAEGSIVLILLTLATFFAISHWPADSILYGMARHRPLAFIAIASALINLALSVLLVRPLGLAGVALGTLIPTAIESIFFVLPYAARVIGVSTSDLIKESFIPSLAPVIPMVVVLYGLRQAFDPHTLLSIMLLSALALAIYASTFFVFSARSLERSIFRSAALTAMRAARLY